MKDYSFYEKASIDNKDFPIQISSILIQREGLAFHNHWHEQIELLYFIKGKGTVKCNSHSIETSPGDILVLNSNDLHCGYCIEKPLLYYCIMFDPSLIKGSINGACEHKYIVPIVQNIILFMNRITGDTSGLACIKDIIDEYERKELGFELSIKSLIYRLLVLLLRNHVDRILTQKEYDIRNQNLSRLNKVFDFIENNYPEKITLDQLTPLVQLSSDHFYHLFKRLTGMGVLEYINHMRIDKAEVLLKNTDMNITEIAMATGFNDANYFSRIFRKYKNLSPSEMRKPSYIGST